MFETAFSPLYCHENGRPAKPIRLMVGLLILKHVRNLSDESVVEQWSENVYYQFFCGQQDFTTSTACEPSDLVHFRKRIGQDGVELILKESVRINGQDSEDGQISVDTTVQEKNITYPTDAKLHKKIIQKCKGIAQKENLPVRQTYTRILKQLAIDQRFRNHPKNKKKAKKADRKMRTIAGRLLREVERNLGEQHEYQDQLALFKRALNQRRSDKNKVYSLHEHDVCCISKGKEHKKYEFGNKVSIAYTQNTGVIVGAKGFRNEYDGHTLEPALKQCEFLVGKAPKQASVDRGYRGQKRIGDCEILVPKPFNKSKMSLKEQLERKRMHQKRAGIEPIIGHLKSDHRLARNFYKGVEGDNINVMLAAAAFNFKRMMRKWKSSFWLIFLRYLNQLFYFRFLPFQPKVAF